MTGLDFPSPVLSAPRPLDAPVLVADVELSSRRRIAAALRHGGYDIEVARTFKQAFSLLRRRRLGAVVVGPPDAEIVEVVRDLRRRTEVAIIVLSGLTRERDKVAVLDAG